MSLFTPALPMVGGGGAASVAAADITDAGAVGVDLVQAETAAEARAALDVTAASPVGIQSTSGSVGWAGATPAAADHLPLARSTSGVLVVYSTQAGSHPYSYIVHRGSWTVRGAYVAINGADAQIVLMNTSGATYATLANVVAATGWHAVAWSISADGATVRYAVDGGAAQSATITAGPLTFVAPDVSDAPHVLYDAGSAAVTPPVGYIALWDAILADADLALLSASPSRGAPDLDTIAGDPPDWAWRASDAARADRLVIDGITYSVTATRPLVWRP